MRPSEFLICILLSFFLHFGFVNGHSSNCTVASTTVYLNRQNAVVAVPFEGFTEKNTQFNTSDDTCFTSFLGSPCNSSCPKNASTVLRITSSRGCKDFQNISNKFGLVSIISAFDFSITFVCTSGICPCAVTKDAKKDQLTIIKGTYKQYLQMEGALRRAMKLIIQSQRQTTKNPKIELSVHDKKKRFAPILEHPLQILLRRKRSAETSKGSKDEDMCYCGTTVITVNNQQNRSQPIRRESCVKGKDDFDPTPQNGFCYVTYEYNRCDDYLFPCFIGKNFYLVAYYNRIRPDILALFEANPNISGHADIIGESIFNITLSCVGNKCEPNWNITEDEIEIIDFNIYEEVSRLLNLVESDLQPIPEVQIL